MFYSGGITKIKLKCGEILLPEISDNAPEQKARETRAQALTQTGISSYVEQMVKRGQRTKISITCKQVTAVVWCKLCMQSYAAGGSIPFAVIFLFATTKTKSQYPIYLSDFKRNFFGRMAQA